MDGCMNCKHAFFDETWGEYKCKKDKKIHYHTGLIAGAKCSYHEKGTPEIAKGVTEEKM